MHGWRNEPTDGPKDGSNCFFLECLQWLQWPPHPQLLDVVWRSAAEVSYTCSVVELLL